VKKTKRGRGQGRKGVAVIIPSSRELDEYAEKIRALGRRSFDNIVEIGRCLVHCRKQFKAQRVWLAWVKAEFGFSRQHADNLINCYKHRGKLLKFSTLGAPISALYLLARASPQVHAAVAERLEAGERPTVGLVRVQIATTEREYKTVRYVSSPEPSEPAREKVERPALDLNSKAIQARGFAQQFLEFVSNVRHCGMSVEEILAELPLVERSQVIEAARQVEDFLRRLARAKATEPRLAIEDNSETRH